MMRGIISHWDIDGIASAVILSINYGIPTRNIKLSSTIKIDKYFNEISKNKVQNVFITDLNPSFQIAENIIKIAEKKKIKLVWIDHHAWDEEAKNFLKTRGAEIIVDEKASCAAELVKNYLYGEQRPPSYIEDVLKLAIDDDTFSNKYEMTYKWRVLLRWGDWSIRYKTLESWIDGYIWPKWAQREFERIDLEYKKLIKSAIEASEYVQTEQGVIAFISSSEKLHPGDIVRELESEGKRPADLYVFIYDKGISLRSHKINVLQIASALGGGGHPYAAGISLIDDVQDKESIKSKIINLLKRLKL
ncbi:phosphoesterase, DHHA1 [Fervidicoccus fontis Kam940]|uniref:Phosphoesterase, DHHA1 n=2 Tax=Fervidicoccus fontis TaxID=683846 RepID=I0A2H1_FERFK|nr:phosphoesterase, DHHA1 [Fervidicoccus fontis Kam940]